MNTPEANRPAVSVVIPTHNRSGMLLRALDALAEQSFAAAEMEVVVVADGCTDETLDRLQSYIAPYRLVSKAQPASGAAEARNSGAAAACGELLVFLDDDVVPTSGFVAAHVAAHAKHAGGVVLGPYPPLPVPAPSQLRLFVREWWTAHFDELAAPGHRFTYRDLLTGNLSISAALWRRLGGLDPKFRKSREDYELGVRLLSADVPFVYAPEALGWHYEHETMTLEGAFRRSFEEGRMDALMGEKHPAVRAGLPLAMPRPARARFLERLIFSYAWAGDVLAHSAQRLLPVLDRMGLRDHYAILFYKLRRYWYVRGVSEYFGSAAQWEDYVREAAAPGDLRTLELDLRQGVASAEARLDEVRPERVLLRFGHHELGTLESEGGAERWRGAHLRSQLFRQLRTPLLRALALEGEIETATKAQRETLAKAIEDATRPRERSDPLNIWEEQQAQWERLSAAP